ncbi:nucleoid-associated protein [Chitinispirillales bacterium ANBcel5]|uniref:nucleoid-associated protein n=1 Tax=Cellulosispirillum alkaliphilum TaxID=3039283 RepID=UPI002A4EFA83|nr:nucleoid-associated protein [Chitinispirillales bacterium ANBcel5]
MITLSADQLASLSITRFIFHVVHHGEDEPTFFDELEIGDFEDFFLDRARCILKGSSYEFNPQSQVREHLEAIGNESYLFVDRSRQLAVNFHSHGIDDKRIKKGVMILMELKALGKEFFAIIKYEHEQVLRYRNDGKKVMLENVMDTFTKSPDAMQKAALIDMSEETPVVMVLDRNVKDGISGFFQGFLNVRRKKNQKELTESLWNVVKDTSKKHLDELPPEFVGDVQQRTEEFVQSRDNFDDSEFFDEVFAGYANDELRDTYRSCLKNAEIEDEPFYLDKQASNGSKKRKLKTAEGITVYFSEKALSTMQVSYGKNGEKDVLIIESERIREEM